MYHKHFNLKIYLNYRRSCTKVTKNEWNRSRLCYRKSSALGLPCTTKKVYNGCFNFFSSTFSWAYKPTHFFKFYENVDVLACYISDLSSSNTCPNWKWSRYFFQVTINYKNTPLSSFYWVARLIRNNFTGLQCLLKATSGINIFICML